MKFSIDANLYLQAFPLASRRHSYSRSEIKYSCYHGGQKLSLSMSWWQGGHSWQSSSWILLWSPWFFKNINIFIFPCLVSFPFPKLSRQKNVANWKEGILQHTSCFGFQFQKSKEEVISVQWDRKRNHKEWDVLRGGSAEQWGESPSW